MTEVAANNEKVFVTFNVHGVAMKIKLPKRIAEHFQSREMLTVAFERGAFAHLKKTDCPFIDLVQLAKRRGCCLPDDRALECAAVLPEKFRFCSNPACKHGEKLAAPQWIVQVVTQDFIVLNFLQPLCADPACLAVVLKNTQALLTYGTVDKCISALACGYCGALEGAQNALRACSKCKIVHYCNSACQAAAWPLHKTTCKPTK